MGKPNLHKHIIQVWKKVKSLNIALIVHLNMPIHTLRLAGWQKEGAEGGRDWERGFACPVVEMIKKKKKNNPRVNVPDKKADIPVHICMQATGNILEQQRWVWGRDRDWKEWNVCVQVFHHQWMGLLHSITEHVLQCIIGAASSSTQSKGSKIL